MRTNVDLDERLIEEAFRYSQSKTKKGLIHEALKEFVENRSRRNLLELEGKIQFREDYDYKAMRAAE